MFISDYPQPWNDGCRCKIRSFQIKQSPWPWIAPQHRWPWPQTTPFPPVHYEAKPLGVIESETRVYG